MRDFYFCSMIDEKKNPWQILGQKNVYDNKWIEVTEFDVLNPSGGKGIYGKVHFKNIAIGVVALDEQMNTYLVGQYRFTVNEYSWEIPEGGGAMGIDPLESAKRELLEETGLVAKDWSFLLTMHLSNSVSDEYGVVFLARDLEQYTAMPEETEELVVKKLPFEEVYQLTKAGKITDSMSMAAILKLKCLQLEGEFWRD